MSLDILGCSVERAEVEHKLYSVLKDKCTDYSIVIS